MTKVNGIPSESPKNDVTDHQRIQRLVHALNFAGIEAHGTTRTAVQECVMIWDPKECIRQLEEIARRCRLNVEKIMLTHCQHLLDAEQSLKPEFFLRKRGERSATF